MSEVVFPEPDAVEDPRTVLLRMLDFHRATAQAKLRSLSEVGLRTSLVPSGWTPIQLGSHLLHMEQRWIVWGFLGEQVEQPWGDADPEHPERWVVAGDATLATVLARWDQVAERTSSVLGTAPLDARAACGGRFEADPPILASIAVHVLQEYARHLGHLDVAVELAGGPTGE